MSVRLLAAVDEQRRRFSALTSARDVADLLEIDYSRLTYHIYRVPKDERYTTFEIPKQSGGVRQISAPATALKILQWKLNQVLHEVYQLKPSVHGFARKRSILSNAKAHVNKRYIFNVDLKDFFSCINFGRVRGMFMGVPYELPEKAATVLAQICCFKNKLPQGAPTSPIITNMICAKMDSELQQLAEKNRCHYTRYADDMTFSTSTQLFPGGVAKYDSSGKLEPGQDLHEIITKNGFEINSEKLRLRTRNRRQEVTGLTVNQFPNVQRKYVRQIRAMLHAWEKFGVADAERDFLGRYDRKHRNPSKSNSSFIKVLLGKIQFLGKIRGTSDRLYTRFAKKFKSLSPTFGKLHFDVWEGTSASKPSLITEGKSDWKHLKSALIKLRKQGKDLDLDIQFEEFEDDKGDDVLLKECRVWSRKRHPVPQICIFDRDNSKIMSKICDENRGYKAWGNNVFSFPIPIPDHRKDAEGISLEFFYKDSEIQRKDKEGRRLFISYEFHQKSLRHKEEELNCTDRQKIKKPIAIIDQSVFNSKNESVALSKDDFARYVLDETENFNDFDVSQFTKIFDIVSIILDESRKENTPSAT